MQNLQVNHIFYKMATYKCFQCEKIIKQDYVKKKVRCPYCGSKIMYKPRGIKVNVKAR